jgi:hypothetical protein
LAKSAEEIGDRRGISTRNLSFILGLRRNKTRFSFIKVKEMLHEGNLNFVS